MRSSWYPFKRRFNSQYGKMYSRLPPKTFEVYPNTLMLASYFATSSAFLCLFFLFLARSSSFFFEAFMSFVFFKFYMHRNLWMSSFQWSWPRLIWSYYRQDIMLKRMVMQCWKILWRFSFKNSYLPIQSRYRRALLLKIS